MTQCKSITIFMNAYGEVRAYVRCCRDVGHDGRHVSNVADSKPPAIVVWEDKQ